jgi:hypothetical protein
MIELRTFIVDPTGVVVEASYEEWLRHMGLSPKFSAAFDILTDDGYSPEKAAELLVAAEKIGRDPEVIARKIVSLRHVIREPL